MDPRERADAALARARARVVTPEDAISPMDAASTLQIPRIVVSALDQRESDPEATMVVQHPLAQSQPTQSQPSPRPPQHHPQQYGPPQQQQHQQGPPRQAQPPEQEQQQHPEGMVPTVKQKPPAQRPTMSQRLDGTL
jgi:hypothetical protein